MPRLLFVLSLLAAAVLPAQQAPRATGHGLYRGKPVYVSEGSDPAGIPAGATILRP